MCGEQRLTGRLEMDAAGSSPRVRGAGQRVALNTDNHGIIPACAGSSTSNKHTVRVRRDHPRVCGEQASALTP